MVSRDTRLHRHPRSRACRSPHGLQVGRVPASRVTSLAALTLGLLPGLLAPPPARAAPDADAAFTVGNYPVDAIDKDAVRAKQKALADGQQAALRSLLRRLVPVTAYRRLAKLQPKPGEMIDGVSVRSERNSSTEYIANLDFSFQPQAVRGYLKREGLPFVDTQAPEIVVVPVLRDAQGGALDASRWSDAWKGLDLAHALAPIKIETLKDSVHPDTLKMAVDGRDDADRILAGEYHNDRVVIAIADLDSKARRINVVFAGRDAVGPFHLKRSWRLAADEAYALEYAAVVGLGVLEGRWKATQLIALGGDRGAQPWSAPQGGGYGAGGYGAGDDAGRSTYGAPAPDKAGVGQVVQIEARFASLGEWNEMRRQLLETPGVEGVEIGGTTARSADITLRYPGGGERLSQTLSAQGLALHSIGTAWSLRRGY